MAGRPRFGLVLRLAWRMARSAPSRSALIVVLVAVPTLGLAGVATVASSMVPTSAESLTAELGSTQAHLTVVSPPDRTLVQSPNSAFSYSFDTDEHGPTGHREDAPLVSPFTYLPAERLLTLRSTTATARTAGGIGSFAVTQGDAWRAGFAGRYARVGGRAPAADREVMVSPALLARLGTRIGGTITVTAPTTLRLQVVGVLRDKTAPATDERLFARPRLIDRTDPRTDPSGTDYYLTGPAVSWRTVRQLNAHGAVVVSRAVVDDPPASAQLLPVQSGLPPQVLIALPIAGFAVLEVVLLAGAAFMVGARRDERTLAMLGCIGADRSALFGVVAATGLVLGVLGGAIGTALGALGAAVYIRLTSDGSTTLYPGFHPWPLLLGGVLALGAVAGLVAAILPARAASRTDVLRTLRGSTRPAPPSVRRPVVGVVVLAVGAVLTLAGAALIVTAAAPPTADDGQYRGPSIGQLVGAGFVFLGPTLMQLGVLLAARFLLLRFTRLAAGFGVGARLGTQDSARNTGRSVPAVAVIMTTLFVGSLVMTLFSSLEASTRATWQYDVPPGTVELGLDALYSSDLPKKAAKAEQLNASLATSFDVRSVHPISATTAFDGADTSATLSASPVLHDRPRCLVAYTAHEGTRASMASTCPQRSPYRMPQRVFAGTAGDLAVMLGEPVSRQSLATLRAGGAVALYPQYVDRGRLAIEWRSGRQLHTASTTDHALAAPSRRLVLPAIVQAPAHDYAYGVFVLTATARAHRLAVHQYLTLAPLRTPPTERQYDRADAAAQAITGGDEQTGGLVFARAQSGPPDTGGVVAWGLLALCALIALAAAAVAIGLSRAEGRRDQWVLTALGASPSLRRSFAFWQTLSITATGATLGVLLGLVPALAVALQPGPQALPFVAPWPQLAAAAIGLPLLVAAVTGLTARPPGRLRAPIA